MTINNIKLRLFEGGSDFVFHHFYPCPVSNDLVSFFNGTDSPDVQSLARVKLERVSSRSGFRAPEHNAYFHSDLVDKNDAGPGFADGAGQFPEGLGHKPGLEANVLVTHFTLDLGTGHQGCD